MVSQAPWKQITRSGGNAKLRAHDTEYTAADAIWTELRVWQDRDQDGLTGDGELSSLDALGIVSLSLTSTPIGATTPQGTQLLAGGEVTFASGRVSRMFEAIFASSDVDTKYAGEGGRADWQGEAALDSKGIGSMTDLAVAAANDNSRVRGARWVA